MRAYGRFSGHGRDALRLGLAPGRADRCARRMV
jgi:hypothetical protein